MQLFSEIYGTYYNVVRKILCRTDITEREISTLILREAFAESLLFLQPKLTGKNSWGLLKKSENKYQSVLKNKPQLPLTLLEKRWLCAVLNDMRSRLFLDKEELELLKSQLDAEPLYKQEEFRFFDIFTDGDNYDSEDYIKNFRTLMTAVHTKEILKISSQTGKGGRITHYFSVLKLEYSPRNDKFRAFVVKLKKGNAIGCGVLNVGRITKIVKTGTVYNGNFSINDFLDNKRCTVPAKIRVSPERNGTERFLLEFASYEKHTEIDDKTGVCTVNLWYDKNDESEVLIKILSFGSVAEILAPKELREQAKERADRQFELLYNR